MSTINTGSNSELIRSELWQKQLEEALYEKLHGLPMVRQLDFPDGSKMTIPSLGQPGVRELPEDAEMTFDGIDSGEISLNLKETIYSPTSISRQFLEDSLWGPEALSRIPEDQAQAIMERVESDALDEAQLQKDGTGNLNEINGAAHRFAASGSSQVMALKDFARANYAFDKAKVPHQGRIAIVDPSVAYEIETLSNLVNVSNNPMFEGIVTSGISQNMSFVRNVYGFDVLKSNLLADVDETVDSISVTGKANLFFNAGDEGLRPVAMSWRRRPLLETEESMKRQKVDIATTARYAMKLVRDENIVVILSDDSQVG